MSYNSKYTGKEIEEILDQVKNGSGLEGSCAYPKVNHESSETTFAITPNTFHVWGEVEMLDLSLVEGQEGVMNEYMFQFTSGSTPTTLSISESVKWQTEPNIEANKTYQVSIVDNIGLIIGV